jgi:hypothetical protein
LFCGELFKCTIHLQLSLSTSNIVGESSLCLKLLIAFIT